MRVYVHIYDSCFYSLGTRPSHTEGKEGLVPRLLLLVLIIILPMTAHYCNTHAQNLGGQRAYPCSTIKDQSRLNQTVIIYYQDLMYIQQDSCTKQVLQKLLQDSYIKLCKMFAYIVKLITAKFKMYEVHSNYIID